jgi:hypothetical protein
MYAWTRRWLHLRRDHTAIRRGSLIDLAFDEDTYAYARRDADETIVIAFNRGATPRTISLPVAAIEARGGSRLSPLLDAGVPVAVEGESATLVVPPRTAVAYELVP